MRIRSKSIIMRRQEILLLGSQGVPDTIDGLQSWHRSGDGFVTDGSNNLSQWSDISGNDRHFVQADPDKRPSSTGETLNQINCVNFDGVDDFMEAENKSSFNHMHSGDSTMLCVAKITDESDVNNKYDLMGSNNNSSGFVGYSVGYDDRSGFSNNNKLVHDVTYGNSTIDVVEATQNNYLPISGEYFILGITIDVDAARLNRARNWLNGTKSTPGISTSSIGTAVDSDSEYTFRIGVNGFEFYWLPGAIAELITYNRVLTDEEMGQLFTYLSDRYSISI